MKKGGGCEIEARGINYHITISKRAHPLKIWSRPDELEEEEDQGDSTTQHKQQQQPGPPTARARCVRQVLRSVSCRARPGELLAIVGPSGAGKSTLLEILAGRLQPSPPPDLLVNGAAADSAELRRVSGYVTQRDVLFPLLTVRETLHFSARLRLGARVPPKDIHARVDALIDDLTLARVAATRVKDLSGGERRRVSIGVEAVHDPAVLILDEPTSGLDSASALQIVGALRAMAESRGRTVVSLARSSSRCLTPFFCSPAAPSSTTAPSTPSTPCSPPPASTCPRTWTPSSSLSTPWTRSASTAGAPAPVSTRCRRLPSCRRPATGARCSSCSSCTRWPTRTC